jgi:RNA polymerase subunit RPABC4/transcription elongation factor Spt4
MLKTSGGPAMGEAVAQKMCLVCKSDCSGRPRVKDERNRYVCRECLNNTGTATVEQALNAAQASAAAYDDGIDIRSAATAEVQAPIADLSVDKACPKCEGFMTDGQRICMRCGYDRKQKRGYRTRVEKVKDPEKSRAVREGVNTGATLLCWALGGIPLAIMAMCFFAPPYRLMGSDLALAASILGNVVGWGTMIMVLVFQFVDGDSGYGFGTIGAVVCLVGAVVALLSTIVLGAVGPILALIFVLMAIGLFCRTIYWMCAVTHRTWLKALGICYTLQIVLAFLLGGLLAAGAIENPWPPGWADGTAERN